MTLVQLAEQDAGVVLLTFTDPSTPRDGRLGA